MTPSAVSAAADGGEVVLIPIGTVDAQGPHMPLGYDYLVADELAKRASDATGAVYTSPICYGVSEALMAFPGTVSIASDILRDLIHAVVSSLYAYGFTHFVVLANHN